jgi:hypothetical protein
VSSFIQKSFRGAFRAGWGISVHGNFSSARRRRNSRSHGTMPNQALSFGNRRVIWEDVAKSAAKQGISGHFQCKIIALRHPWKTPSRCKNTV